MDTCVYHCLIAMFLKLFSKWLYSCSISYSVVVNFLNKSMINSFYMIIQAMLTCVLCLFFFNVYLSLMPNYVISKHISIVLMHLLDPVYMTTFSKFGGISRLCCSRVTSTSLCNGMSLRYPSQRPRSAT